MKHVFTLEPYGSSVEELQLRYEGTGLRHQLLVGPGRPDEGHTHLVVQAKYSPAPPMDDGEGVLVVVQGPLTGRSRTGLSLYGGMAAWTTVEGDVRARPVVQNGGGKSRLVQKVGPGWLVAIRSPRVVRWERPSGRRSEAHCASEEWFPPDSIAVWADAVQGLALCGELLDCLPEYLGEPVGEPLWLPTTTERRRLLWALRPDAYVVASAACRGAGMPTNPTEELVPPWAKAPTDTARVYALANRLLLPGDEEAHGALRRVVRRSEAGTVLPAGARFQELDNLPLHKAAGLLAGMLRGDARWTNREAWEAAQASLDGPEG